MYMYIHKLVSKIMCFLHTDTLHNKYILLIANDVDFHLTYTFIQNHRQKSCVKKASGIISIC